MLERSLQSWHLAYASFHCSLPCCCTAVNDDIQGTGSVVTAGVVNGLK